MSLRGILLMAALFPSMPLCFFRPFYGVVLWTIIAFASPQWLAWDAGYLFPVAEMVAIPTLLGFAMKPTGLKRLATPHAVLMIILWLWFTVTSIAAANTPLFMPHAEQTWMRWQFVTKVMFMSLVTLAIVDSFWRLRTLVI